MIISVDCHTRKLYESDDNGEIEGILVMYLIDEKVDSYWTASTNVSTAAQKIFECFPKISNKEDLNKEDIVNDNSP